MKIKICILIILLVWQTCQVQKQQPTQIISRINSQKRYINPQTSKNMIYSIDMVRIQSDKQSEKSKCQATQRKITVSEEKQLFRLSINKDKNRRQSIYQILTTLNDNQNMIQQFQKVGDKIFIITSNSKGYFIDQNNLNPPVQIQLGIKIRDNLDKYTGNIVILDFNSRALVITNTQIALCQINSKRCDLITGFNTTIKFLIDAKLFIQDTKTYLFIFPGDTIIIYQLTANGKLQNLKIYDKKYFNTDKIHIRTVIPSGQNKFIFLDSLVGLREVEYLNQINNFKENSNVTYRQGGCYKMIHQNQGQYIVLSCTLNMKSYFIMELIRSKVFGIYQAQGTIFRRETIYDIQIQDNTIMSRVFSGIRLYWASKSLEKPYPYDYLHAGDIFLHNAIEAKMFLINNKQVIFLATDDQMRRYQLRLVQPYIQCYSSTPIKQSYKIQYTFPCLQKQLNPINSLSKICKSSQILSYQAWQHKQIKLSTMIIPFILLLIGTMIIGLILLKLCRNYNTDIESVRLKYNVDNNEFGLDSNR